MTSNAEQPRSDTDGVAGTDGAEVRRIDVPSPGLVVLCGPSGSGKSTFAARHFGPTEIVSSDRCRALVGDDETDQSVTALAFELLHDIVDKRLALGRLTVVDSTSVKPEDRRSLVELARKRDSLATAIVFDVPLDDCLARNADRTDRRTPDHAIKRQFQTLRRTKRAMGKERFSRIHTLSTTAAIDTAVVSRVRLWNDRRNDSGPFDLIGDVHGCDAELVKLLEQLGYSVADWLSNGGRVQHPDGRRVVFLGDLVDRGPGSDRVLEVAMHMVESGDALCIMGNHENKLVRALNGRNVTVSHGLAESLVQLEARGPAFTEAARTFMDGLVSHYVLDEGRLVVAHAGLPEHYHGRASGRVRSFALYGDTTGETDDVGLPVRYPWAEDYRGSAAVVYGHTPVPGAEWNNNTICLDTGCVFGGELTALRWPEKELVSVVAEREYYAPTRPLHAEVPDRPARLLDVDEVLGTHRVETSLAGRLTIDGERSSAALEIMSRFSVDPRWLCYLPPTMAPVNTSDQEGLLEHPHEAFAYFRKAGVAEVVCEEKHMGSRAVVIVAADPGAAQRRFGIANDEAGVIVTRTGRAFFDDGNIAAEILDRLRAAATSAGWWDRFGTDWFVLDAEILPWSAKAESLLRSQYAPVAVAGQSMLASAKEALAAAMQRGVGADGELQSLADRTARRAEHVAAYAEAYGRYCWDVQGIAGLKLAPFQLMAAEGEVLARRAHRWHLETIDELAGRDPELFRSTDRRHVSIDDPDQVADAVSWWVSSTGEGAEGMVVKPANPIERGQKGLVLAGVKVRGSEYLRIIYGPEYLEPDNLDRLRKRGLGRKSSLARREFALGIEALDRFVANEHPYRVHECVFGVLALESEPVDPRL